MTLLDRFRSQPPQKHSDPSIRLAFVAELPVDDRQTIAAMAREDADARVRRAAVAKLLDVEALAVVVRSDADEGVRSRAREMLRDIALEVFEGLGETDALAAADATSALQDARVIGHIAKSATRDTVALRALASVSDGRMLGSVARHAASEAARAGALDALIARGDSHEILAVALNGEYKEAAILAVGVLTDRTDLEQVAARSRNKNAVKRARVILREQDERVAREAAEQAAAAAEATRVAADAHAQEVPPFMSTDALLSSSSTPDPSTESSAPPPAADPAPTIASLTPTHSLPPHDEAPWEGAPPPGQTDANTTDVLVSLDPPIEAPAVDSDGVAPAPAVASDTTDAAARPERENAVVDADVRARREGLARMHNLLGRAEQLSVKPDISLKAADRALRDVRAALAGIPPLPSRADYEDVHKRLKAVQDALAPKVNELREADEWQKWANVTIQEQLCAKMEALSNLEDAEAIAREVRELQQQWRGAADVPRDKADALWRRFKAAHDTVWAKCEAHFAAEAQARVENLTKKTALCEQAEALADSTSWIQTAESIKQLQAEWKAIGPVSRGREKAIWDRFRTACDKFFTRRNADLAQRKGVWADNLAKKDALCVRAEAVAESSDWDVAAAQIKQLQSEWKTIGPVKKSRSEAIWQRFRTACDKFFERYAQRHNTVRAERVAARETICTELEALAAANEGAEAPADLLSTVRSVRGRWQAEVAARGVDPDRARALDARYADAFAALVARWPAAFNGTDLDPDANRKRMEALVKKIEDLATSLTGGATAPKGDLSPANKLATMLKEALAANTIGGKVEDDSRMRAAADELRQAQAAWSRLGPVAEPTRRQLADRFQRAARRIGEKVDASPRATGGGRPQGRPAGGGGRPPAVKVS